MVSSRSSCEIVRQSFFEKAVFRPSALVSSLPDILSRNGITKRRPNPFTRLVIVVFRSDDGDDGCDNNNDGDDNRQLLLVLLSVGDLQRTET